MQPFDAAAKAIAADMRQAGESMQKDQAAVAANVKRLTWKLHTIALDNAIQFVIAPPTSQITGRGLS